MPPFAVAAATFIASWARAHRRGFAAAVLAVSIALWASAVMSAWLIVDVVIGLPNREALHGVGSMSRATTIFDAHDQPVFTLFKERRIEVPLSRMSPHLIDAILAVEDQRFFDHGGLDVIRVGGAAWKNLRHGWGSQGGSTITQQLARLSFLTREKTIRRKLKEIVLAARLEQTYSKDQILGLYLNKVYFGDGLYGVEAASLGYFGKHASDVDLSEAALLAGLVKAPSVYAPTVNLDRALMRRKAVLDAMRAVGIIDDNTARTALARPVRLHDRLRERETYGQYFKEEVRQQLVEQFGWELVHEGGLRVYTTLDMELQRIAEAEVQRALTEIEQRQLRGASTDLPLQAALVAIDPQTGEIRTMVGGRSFADSRFNRAMQARRQAGSAFKPFVYAAALERGFTPATLITPLQTPIMTLEGAWVPDDHSTTGTMTMRSALRYSSNRAAVSMLQIIGIPSAIRAAERFGIESVPGVWSLALGSGEVSLLSMTAAYAAFANNGMRPSPIMIRRVAMADGRVVYSGAPRADRAVSEATAFLMTAMLSDVLNGGTGWQARRQGFTLPAAGKTGTTNDYRDAWFVGYTSRLATGVWVGYDRPRTIMRRGYAATLAVPLWGRFMAAATRDHEATPFRPPRTVVSATICRLSGMLATSACQNSIAFDTDGNPIPGSMAYIEYFTRGTEPIDYCSWHQEQMPPHIAVAENPQLTGEAPVSALPLPLATSGLVPVTSSVPEVPRVQKPSGGPGFWSRLFGRGRPDEGRDSQATPNQPQSTSRSR